VSHPDDPPASIAIGCPVALALTAGTYLAVASARVAGGDPAAVAVMALAAVAAWPLRRTRYRLAVTGLITGCLLGLFGWELAAGTYSLAVDVLALRSTTS
jgi:hypothetical protein